VLPASALICSCFVRPAFPAITRLSEESIFTKQTWHSKTHGALISINFAQFSGLTLCRPQPLRSGRIEAECEVDGTAVGRRSTIKTFAPRNPSIQFFRLTCQEVDFHQGAGRCVVIAANVVCCRLTGDDYIIEGANRFFHVVQDRAADELMRAVSLPNELQIDYDQIDARGSEVVALQR
jgi:hypothetical protein